MYGPLFRHCLFPLYETVLRGRPTTRFFAQYNDQELLTPDQLSQLQSDGLRHILQHCWDNISFYRRQWQELGLVRSDLSAPETALKRLSILTKAEIRENFEALQASDFPGGKVTKATGGSTGTPLTFAHDRDSYYRRTAVMWRGYGWSGFVRGERTLYLWGTTLGNQSWRAALKEHLHNRFFNRRMFSCFGMTDAILAEYVRQYERYRPRFVVGYVSALVDFAQYLIGTDKELAWRPDSIITGAEPLFEADRKVIEEGFKAPVYNTYGCREFMLIAAECEHRQGLHISSDQLYVEVLNHQDQPVLGEPGRLVITDLHNRGMPFIRYELGDEAVLDEQPCACGRPFPLLKKIEGRQLDTLTTMEGKRVPGEFFPHLIKDVATVKQYQVIQEQQNQIAINLVVDSSYGADDERYLRHEITSLFGEGMQIDFHRVDQIDQTVGGKRRVTINRVTST